MRQIRGFSLGVLAIAATAMFAAVAPSSAIARTSAHARTATHFTAQRAHHASYHRYRAYGAGPASAYGAILGGSGFASPSYPGYGYGYGDNSHSYTN
jgi:hypothetical protein